MSRLLKLASDRVRGWVTRGIIAASEVAAGRRHHRNYRDFMARTGLPPLLDAHELSVDQRKIRALT